MDAASKSFKAKDLEAELLDKSRSVFVLFENEKNTKLVSLSNIKSIEREGKSIIVSYFNETLFTSINFTNLKEASDAFNSILKALSGKATMLSFQNNQNHSV